MNTCKNCQKSITEDETVYTDYFQVKKGVPVYTLCGDCYLKEVHQYLAEEKPTCGCGAPEVLVFEDDPQEVIDMGIAEALLNLECSEIHKRRKAGASEEELEEMENDHTVYGLYTYDVPTDDNSWT
jgi:hypothetical protein